MQLCPQSMHCMQWVGGSIQIDQRYFYLPLGRPLEARRSPWTYLAGTCSWHKSKKRGGTDWEREDQILVHVSAARTHPCPFLSTPHPPSPVIPTYWGQSRSGSVMPGIASNGPAVAQCSRHCWASFDNEYGHILS